LCARSVGDFGTSTKKIELNSLFSHLAGNLLKKVEMLLILAKTVNPTLIFTLILN
jgi:hypothetical protein